MALEGIHSGDRFRAADGEAPRWLATYDVDLAVLDTPAYRALREQPKRPRARRDRPPRHARPAHLRAARRPRRRRRAGPRWSIAVSLTVAPEAEDELAAWYAEEHVPLLHAIPGWRRTRRLRAGSTATRPRFLALHELDGPEPMDTDAYRARHLDAPPRRG